MTKLQKEVIKAYADCGMSIGSAAKKLYRHRNTVWYHLEQVREHTGLDPKNFHDLVKLYNIAIAEDAPHD